MPFYTYKCPKCKKEKDFLLSVTHEIPTCVDIKMERIYKPNANPGSKDGSWGFGSGAGKPRISGTHSTPEAAMKAMKGKK